MPKFTTPSFLAFFLLLGALAMFTIITVSSPIWNPIYFLESNNAGAITRFGLWGGCGQAAGAAKQCSGYNIGYAPNDILALSGNNVQPRVDGTVRNLTYAMVINIIAAGFTLFAFAASLISICGIAHFFTFILTAIAFLFGATALAVDLALWIIYRNRLNEAQPGTASLGKATWFAVAGAGALLLALFLLLISHAQKRKQQRERDMDFPADYEDTQELRTTTVPPSEVVSAYPEQPDHGAHVYERPQSDFVETDPHAYYNNAAAVPAAGYVAQPQYPVAQPTYPVEKSYPAQTRQESYYSNRENQPAVVQQSSRMSLNPHDNVSHRGSYVDSASQSGLPDPIPVKF